MNRRGCVLILSAVAALAPAARASAQTPLRKLGEMELALLGVNATVEPLRPVVPRNVAAAVQIVVRAGDSALSSADVERFLGPGFEVQGELSGPGLAGTVSLPQPIPGVPELDDPLLLQLPALNVVGDYQLANLRIVSGGRTVLDVTPSTVVVKVSEILVTSVQTRPLTLDEIRQRGIVLDHDDYLGFDFIIGMKLESTPINLSFPVVFDRQGVPVPQALVPPAPIGRSGIPFPTLVPLMLEAGEGPDGEPDEPPVIINPGGGSEPVRIPSVLVIPGNVGYLKQFFSAQLFVANGAPTWSNLTLRDVKGLLKLPEGPEPGPDDDPLALPEILRDGQVVTQPLQMAVRGVGLDAEPNTPDDTDVLAPAQQGQAEFLLRGEKEGFHTISFDITATLEGLPNGPVHLKGKATGGVLVRNPFFDVTFTVPSVVRAQERFKVYVTVNNISKAIANDVYVDFDSVALSGAELAPGEEGVKHIDTLRPRDSKVLTFEFKALRTGQVVASYLRFDTDPGSSGGNRGHLNFALGVGERGIPLSPDTLVLPSAVEALPLGVVDAAMRVLGQAWSIANAPAGTLQPGVLRTGKPVVVRKALALAEAGLRVQLGQDLKDALRDVLFDFYGSQEARPEGSNVAEPDPGFDQLLRQTAAGRDFVRALGAALEDGIRSGGADDWEREASGVAASGADFLAFSVSSSAAVPAAVSLRDATGRATLADAGGLDEIPQSDVPGAVIMPVGTPGSDSHFGLLAAPIASGSPYVIELLGRDDDSVGVSATLPDGEGGFRRLSLSGLQLASGSRARITFDLEHARTALVEADLDGDGAFESRDDVSTQAVTRGGPRLVAATMIGPETLPEANPWGLQAVFLFDRLVDPVAAARPSSFAIANNSVRAARRQLSGRLVFASLARPEGPCVATSVRLVERMLDERGIEGPLGEVALGNRLHEPGTVVRGRVLNADGSPVTGAAVSYVNNLNWKCESEIPCTTPRDGTGLAATPVGDDGSYEFRFVRQDACGCPFFMVTQDPLTQTQRTVQFTLHNPPDTPVVCSNDLQLDLVLLGRGSVHGVVRDLTGARIQDAYVVAQSQTDPQSGGSAHTGPDGSYTISGITVGAITVNAAQGDGTGVRSGRIDVAGATAEVDVTLDSGAANVSGTVRQFTSGVTTAAAGATVVYFYTGNNSRVPLAVTYAASDGTYAFQAMPVGSFSIEAAVEGAPLAALAGIAAVGNNPGKDLLVVFPPPQDLGTVKGRVLFADGTPADHAFVTLTGYLGVYTDANGRYELPGVPVRPYSPQWVSARLGRRSATATFSLNEPGEVVDNVDLRLSGIGKAVFVVRDPAGNPVAGQTVGIFPCSNACGCQKKATDAEGIVEFADRAVGSVGAVAVGGTSGILESAFGSATILADGAIGQGVLQYKGAGLVRGIVREPLRAGETEGRPAHGADVAFGHFAFDLSTCAMAYATSTFRTGLDGSFEFPNIPVGPVSVYATHPFLPQRVGASGNLTRDGEVKVFDVTLIETFAGELSGDVRLPDGVTSAGSGVEVTVNGPLPDVTVRTDANGHYRFAEILPAGYYTFTARDPRTGYVFRDQIVLRAGQPFPFDVRLKGRGTVRVTVVDGANQPLDQAFLRLTEGGYPNRRLELTVSPGQQGLGEFTNVFEGPFSVEAFDALGRGGRVSGTVAGPGATAEVTLRVTITGTVKGRFLMPDQATPIPYGVVKLLVGGRLLGQITTSGSGDDVGSFQFDYVPAGPVRLEAQDPLTARNGIAAGTLEQEGQILALDVIAEAIGSVSGRVTSNEVAQAGAEVRLVSGSYQARTLSDPDGSYALDGVPIGRVSVTASLGSQFLAGTAAGNLTTEGEHLTLDVPLRDSATVVGQVTKWDGSVPGPVSLVNVYVGGIGGGSQSVSTDVEGGFTFDRVPTGSATFNADAVGSIDLGRASTEVVAPGPVMVSVVMNGVGRLHGTALNGPGGSPTGGTLTLIGSGPFPYYLILALPSDGVFHLPEVLAGPYTARLSANLGGIQLYGTATGTIAPDQDNELQIELQPSATVTGRVMRADGLTPAIGADVLIKVGGAQARVQAGSDGAFTARGVPLGSVEIRVSDLLTGGAAYVAPQPLTEQGLDVGTLVLDDSIVSVVSISPAAGAQGVSVTQPIVVVFSDPLANPYGIYLSRNGGFPVYPTGTTLSADGRTVTLTGTWPDAQDITVNVTTAVTDVYGRHLVTPALSAFHTVDLSGPAVNSVTPANNAIQQTAATVVRVTYNEPLSATANHAAAVVLKQGSTTIPGSVAFEAPATLVFTPAAPLALNATYSVIARDAVDLSGNVQTIMFGSLFKSLDTIPPTLTLSGPPPGGWTINTKPLIYFSVSDALTGIAAGSGAMVLDGVSVAATTSPYVSFTPTMPLSEGQHTVVGSVADVAGNTNQLTAAFGVDSVAPSIAAFSGVDDGQTVSGTIVLTGSAADATSGVAKIEFLREGATLLGSATAAQSFQFSLNTNTLGEGYHDLTARAVDVAGLTGPVSVPVRVLVNNHVVTVSITSPAQNALFRDSVTVDATVSETVQRVDFQAGTLTTVTDTTTPYQATLDLAGLSDGVVTLRATATGLDGETATTTRDIRVDRTPPNPPDVTRMSAESDGSSALVLAQPGAVEAGARVEALNLDTGATGFTPAAAADGSFALRVSGLMDQSLSLTATDAAGNRSAASVLTISAQVTQDGVPLTGLKIWAKADTGVTTDANGRVSSWQNQVDPANPLVQATATQQPLLVPNAVGGKPVLRFDGSNDFVAFTTRQTTIRTVFWVVREDVAAGFAYRSLLGDAAVRDFEGGYGGPGTIWRGDCCNNYLNVVNGQTWVNGEDVVGTTATRPRTMSVVSVVTTGNTTADRFGTAVAVSAWFGDLAELMVYERPLSGSEQKAVEDYLALRYALYVPSVATPTISPNGGGAFSGSTTVTLATTTPLAQIYYTADGSEPSTASTLYTAPITIDRTTTLKAKAYRPGLFDSGTAIATFIRSDDFSPGRVAGLRLWLRADAGVTRDASGRVSAWADQSGSANDALQDVSAQQPHLVPDVVNGLPAMRFDGTDDFVKFPQLTTIRTVFWVVKEDSAAGFAYRSLLGDAALRDFEGGYGAPGTIWRGDCCNNYLNVINGQTWMDGAPITGTATPRPRTMSVLSVVTTGNVAADRFGKAVAVSPWFGDLAELVIYERALNVSERQEVEAYLLTKYGTGSAVLAPTISPAGGMFSGSVTASLSTATPGAEIHYTTDGTQPTLSSLVYDGPLTFTQTTTLKAIAIVAGVGESATTTASFTSAADFTPRNVTGLRLWLRADAGVPTGFGDLWQDQSDAHNDATQALGSAIARIVPDVVNGLPAMHFDGLDDFVKFPQLTTIRTVFWVVNEDSAAGFAYRSLLGDAALRDFEGGYGAPGTIWRGDCCNNYLNVINGQTWMNGSPISGVSTPRPRTMSVLSLVTTETVTADRFGKAVAVSPWFGDLAELVIYDRVLTVSERQAVEHYLLTKYGTGSAVLAPKVSPAGGMFSGSVNVTLSTPTPGAEVHYTTDGTEPTLSSLVYDGPLTFVQTTTLKAKAIVPLVAESATTTVGFTREGDFTPRSLTGLKLWLRADAGVPTLFGDLWQDQSDAHNDATQTLGSAIAAVAPGVVNGLPAMHFDGTSRFVKFPQLTTIRTVFWVVREDSAAGFAYRSLLGDAALRDFEGGYGAPGTIWRGDCCNNYLNVTTGQTFKNGASISGTTAPRPRTTSILSLVTSGNTTADRFGTAVAVSPWWGDLAELVVYDRPLTASERKSIEQYLGARYGIAVQP